MKCEPDCLILFFYCYKFDGKQITLNFCLATFSTVKYCWKLVLNLLILVTECLWHKLQELFFHLTDHIYISMWWKKVYRKRIGHVFFSILEQADSSIFNYMACTIYIHMGVMWNYMCDWVTLIDFCMYKKIK